MMLIHLIAGILLVAVVGAQSITTAAPPLSNHASSPTPTERPRVVRTIWKTTSKAAPSTSVLAQPAASAPPMIPPAAEKAKEGSLLGIHATPTVWVIAGCLVLAVVAAAVSLAYIHSKPDSPRIVDFGRPEHSTMHSKAGSAGSSDNPLRNHTVSRYGQAHKHQQSMLPSVPSNYSNTNQDGLPHVFRPGRHEPVPSMIDGMHSGGDVFDMYQGNPYHYENINQYSSSHYQSDRQRQSNYQPPSHVYQANDEYPQRHRPSLYPQAGYQSSPNGKYRQPGKR